MNTHIPSSKAQAYARVAGLLYLVIIILGAVQEFYFRGKIIVTGNAFATASNLQAMESLWRWGIACELFLVIITIVFSWLLFILTKPVNKNIALLALFFGLVATTVEAAYSLQLLEALFPFAKADYLKAFTPEQLYAFSSLALKSHSIGFGIGLLLFGPFFIVTGYLIINSGYFPKAIGVIYLIPGISYLISSFALILAPAFASRNYFIMAGPAGIGELLVCLWLLVKGVNANKWDLRQASTETDK